MGNQTTDQRERSAASRSDLLQCLLNNLLVGHDRVRPIAIHSAREMVQLRGQPALTLFSNHLFGDACNHGPPQTWQRDPCALESSIRNFSDERARKRSAASAIGTRRRGFHTSFIDCLRTRLVTPRRRRPHARR